MLLARLLILALRWSGGGACSNVFHRPGVTEESRAVWGTGLTQGGGGGGGGGGKGGGGRGGGGGEGEDCGALFESGGVCG